MYHVHTLWSVEHERKELGMCDLGFSAAAAAAVTGHHDEISYDSRGLNPSCLIS